MPRRFFFFFFFFFYVARSVTYCYASGVGSAVLASANADAKGSFTATGHAPAAPFGPRIFLAAGLTSGKIGAASFSVTPRLVLSPDAGTPGSQTTVSGYGYGPSEKVKVYWNNPKTSLGEVTTDIHGSLTGAAALTFTVPAAAPAGEDEVSGNGVTSGARGVGHFTVE